MRLVRSVNLDAMVVVYLERLVLMVVPEEMVHLDVQEHLDHPDFPVVHQRFVQKSHQHRATHVHLDHLVHPVHQETREAPAMPDRMDVTETKDDQEHQDQQDLMADLANREEMDNQEKRDDQHKAHQAVPAKQEHQAVMANQVQLVIWDQPAVQADPEVLEVADHLVQADRQVPTVSQVHPAALDNLVVLVNEAYARNIVPTMEVSSSKMELVAKHHDHHGNEQRWTSDRSLFYCSLLSMIIIDRCVSASNSIVYRS